MEREFAKWILDIAKYVTTALVLSNVFSDMSNGFILVSGIFIAFACVVGGLYIIYRQDKKDQQREKNRNKNKNRR